jgi:hypothetical protein
MTGKCECRRPSDEDRPCGHSAAFRVQVGTRKTDAQLSCGSHLARTCMVMAYGDGGLGDAPKPLTVIMLRPV